MKKHYIITKKVVATSIADAVKKAGKGEVVEVSLLKEEVLEEIKEMKGFSNGGK